jgi:nitrogen fixation protein NifX
MSTPAISNAVALRIGLASQVLPHISLPELIQALQTHFGVSTITEESLSQLSVTQLKQCFDNFDQDKNTSHYDLASLQEAVRLLWGETSNNEETLPVEAYQESDWPNSIRVAVASNTGEQLDGHFGSCHRYLIYQLAVDKLQLIDVRSAVEADLADDKNRFRVNLIQDCAIVYVVSIGGPAAAKVIQGNIYPMKKEQGGSAREILAQLQSAIATSPPPWLAKLLGINQSGKLYA